MPTVAKTRPGKAAARATKRKSPSPTKNERPLPHQRFGSHLSVAGGFENAFNAAVELGCDCLQIFVKNQKQWKGPPLTEQVIRDFKAAQRRTGVKPVVAHASYLINLASPDDAQWQRSIDAVTDELHRCEALGVSGLVVHPGAHMKCGVPAGITRIAAGLDAAHHRTAGFRTRVLLETTAGQGTAIGASVEELGAILNRVSDPARVGICLDTCHLFAAGYDLRKPDACAALIDLIRREVTLRRVKCIHTNDSKGKRASRLDRHEHIGKGKLGTIGFRYLLNEPRLAGAIRILETPKGEDRRGVPYDRRNLATLRRLVGMAAPKRSQPPAPRRKSQPQR